MDLDNHQLVGISAIKNLTYIGEIREDSYKKAVLLIDSALPVLLDFEK